MLKLIITYAVQTQDNLWIIYKQEYTGTRSGLRMSDFMKKQRIAKVIELLNAENAKIIDWEKHAT